MTSLPREQADAARIADYLRGHWRIESRLHWVREVTYVRTGNST